MPIMLYRKSNNEEDEKKRKQLLEQLEINNQNESKKISELFEKQYSKTNNIPNIPNTQNKGNIFNDIGKFLENTWLGLQNGVIDFNNTMGKRMIENQNSQSKMFREQDKRIADELFKKGKINEEEYNRILNNPFQKEINFQPANTIKKQKNTEKIESNAENSSNIVGKYLNANIAPAIGNMLPALIPGAGTIYMAGSSAESYYEEAKKRGMNEQEANSYSTKMSMADTLLELVPIGKIMSTGKNASTQTIKNTLKDIGISGIEEGIQEGIMEPIGELFAGDKYADWDNMGQRMFSSALAGGLVGSIMSGASAGVGSCQKIADKINARQNVTQQEINTAIADAKANGVDVNEVFKQNAKSEINKISEQQNGTRELPQNIENKSDNNINPIAPIMQENANIQQNEKINNFRQDANKFWINNEQSQGLSSVIEKVINDKGYNIRLDDTINKNGKSVNAQITNLDNNEIEIRINPNSNNIGEFLLMHEVTHGIETKEIKGLVLDYAKNNKDFESALNSLKETYNTDDVSSEVVADISAQLFGNQEFINNLSMEKPSLFKQIYNKIIEWANKLTGNSHESLFIRDLKNKWEEAYRTQNNNLNNETYNSIERDSKGYKYVKADRQVISGDDPELWKKQTEKYIDEKIRQNKDIKVYTADGTELTITKNTSGKATFRNEVRQADGTTRKLNDKEFASKLRAETHIDELGTVSKYKNGPVPDTKNHKFAKDGFTYRDAYFEDIDGQYYKITMSVGKNGDINTIYNVGKMKQAQKNRRFPIRELKGSSGQTTKDRNSSNKSIAPVKNDVNTSTKYSMQESENNSGSFNLPINKQKRLEYLKSIDTSNMSFLQRSSIKQEIASIENGFNSVDEYINYKQEQRKKQIEEYDKEKIKKQQLKEEQEKSKQEKLKNEIKNASPHKREQYNIIQNNNPMLDDYHVGIRSPADIKTAEEVFTKTTFEEEGTYPDFTFEMSQQALKDGFINVYSSYPIKQGTFISTSKMQAVEYAGGDKNKIYTKKVPLEDVAWILNTEGQYAKVDKSKYSIPSKNWSEYLQENYKSNGTKTNLKDIRLPIKTENIIEKTLPKAKTEVLPKSQTNKDTNILNELYNDRLTLKEQYGVLNQKIVNKGYYIDKLAEKRNNLELKFKYDRMLGAVSEGQYEVEHAQTDNNGKKIGKSINQIWKPVEDSKLVKEFSEYLLYKHNIDRAKKGKPIFGENINAETSKTLAENYEKLYPDFKEWAKDINTFNKNQLQNMVDAGLTSKEMQEYLDNTYSNYVTVSRAIDDNGKVAPTKGKRAGTNNPIKRAIGGNSDIQPLKDAMAKQAIAVKQAIRMNDVGLELMNILPNVEKADNYDINNVVSSDSKGARLIVFDKGEAKSIKIDSGLYESLKPTQKSDTEKTWPFRLVQKVSEFQRSVLTVDNPLFMITNFFKDLQDGMFNSKYTANFLPNYGRALKEIATKGEMYELYKANGGEANTYFDYNKGVKKTSKVGKFVEKIRGANEVVEMAPRLAEFISTMEDGKSINEAMYNAAEITTNFKRGGEATKFLNRNGVNFLNASVQGLSKQVRNITGQNGVKGYVNLLAKATLLGVAPSVLNHMLLDDDEDYKDLPDYVKDTFYLFKTGEGEFIRIPKGRVLSIFGSTAIRTLEYAKGNKEAYNGLKETVKSQIAPNNPFTSNIASAVGQVMSNKTWYDSDLVPTRLQNQLPKNQYDETTDSLSKWIGQTFNVSPIKVNYLLDQYSGGIGDVILPFLTPQARSNPLSAKFTIDSVTKNKNVSKFYETVDEQTKLANDVEPSDEDKLKVKYLNSIQSEISKLYKEKRETQLSDLKNDVKKKTVRDIQANINEIVENALETYNDIKKGSNYAQIGDKKYYLNDKGEWTALTTEEELKNRNISIKTYANYKEKLYKEKEKQVNNGVLKESQQLNSKDKINILLNSNYSKAEKSALYENYIKSSDDSTYDIASKFKIDIDNILNYKLQDFSSDKEDNGTVKGKSVSGSAKNKVVTYLNNSNMKYNDKLVLLGMKYSLNNKQKEQLFNYIDNNSSLSKDDKLEIFNNMSSNFIVYKDGKVQIKK